MPNSKYHIVIAEDDADDAEIISLSFAKHPSFSQIDIVQNGRELVDFLQEENNHLPDVILTDINMPILTGIEALKIIRKDEKLHSIPAFVYSTTINPTYEALCRELGIKKFLIKPYDLKGFDEIPNKILKALSN